MDHYLSKIILQNIQTIEEYTEIPIEPITILLGPNNAGKSAILDVIQSVIPTCLGNKYNWMPDENDKNRKEILLKSFRNNSEISKIGIEYTYTSKGIDPDLFDENDLHNISIIGIDPLLCVSRLNGNEISIPGQDRNIIFGQIFHPILNDGTVSILPSRDPKDENKLQCIKILHMFTFSNAICRGKLEGYTLTVDDRVVLEFQSGNSKRGLSKEKQKEPRKRPEDLIKEIREQKKYPDTFDIYYKNQKWVRWQKKPFSTDNNPIDYFERHTLEETEVVGGLRTRFKRPDYNDSFPSLNFLKPHEVAGDRKFWDHWNHIILLAGYDAAQDALKIGSGQKNLTPASR